MLRKSLLARWMTWCTAGLAMAEDLLHNHCRFWLQTLASLLAVTQEVTRRIFEWESRILSVTPSGVYLPRDSAIVIIGGVDGLGQTIALNLSENGYTVFVLCPSTAGTCNPAGQCETIKSSDVSSLLYAWHKKKERSTQMPWGMVAPISFDMNSEAQRGHALETVHAYCVKHSLNMVALIVLSPPSPVKRNEPDYCRDPDTSIKLDHRDPSSSTWECADAHFLIESILVIQDYVGMLAKASGRVIFLSYEEKGCYFCKPASLLDGVFQRISHNISNQMDKLGIRVTSISVGPIGQSNNVEHDVTRPQRTHGVNNSCSRSLHRIISSLLASCCVADEVVCGDLRNLIATRYPRYSYCIGIYPIIESIVLATPDFLRHLVTYWIR